MNMELFRLINNLVNINTALDSVMVVFSKYVPYVFMLAVAAVYLIGVKQKNSDYRKAAFSTFIFTVINLGLGFIIGSIYYVDRPFVHNKVNLLAPHSADASFPSDHATGTMSIALGLRINKKALNVVLTILSVIVGFSRVYVGHHYPLDVIGAYAIVALTNYIFNLKLRGKIEDLYEAVEEKAFVRLGTEN